MFPKKKKGFINSMIGVEKKHCDKSIVFQNIYTLRQLLERRKINVLLLHTSVCPILTIETCFIFILSCHRNSHTLESLHSIFFTYFYSSRHFHPKNFVLNILKDESVPYRKLGQTRKVKQPSHNTTTKPF